MSDEYLNFIYKYRSHQFYQPIILEPGSIEKRGLWDDATKKLSNHLLSNIEGKAILDVGCNVGFFLHDAWRKGASKLVGIDNDPVIIKIAKEVTILLKSPIKLSCINENAYKTTSQFELILMLNILDFVESPTQCIKKYLSLTSGKIVIEHEDKHARLFPCKPSHQEESPRAGGRLLSFFSA